MSKEYNPQQGRGDRRIQERVHDPYMTRSKPSEPSVCSECGVVFANGRWQWMDPPAGAETLLCPACQRVRDRVPAGFVHLSGEFFHQHRDEILNLARNESEQERGEHPMNRIMAMDEEGDGVVITTTDIHSARRIGDAIESAYEGECDYHYAEGENLLRVTWRR